MKYQTDVKEKFRGQLDQRLKLANEAAAAILIYALIYVHQDAQRSEFPFLLDLVYHPTYGEYVYANPSLLRSVLMQCFGRKVMDSESLAVWQQLACLCQIMHDKTKIDDLPKYLYGYAAALRKPRIPKTRNEENTITAVADFHQLLGEMLSDDDRTGVPKLGDKDSYINAADKLRGFASALNWAAESLDGSVEKALGQAEKILNPNQNNTTSQVERTEQGTPDDRPALPADQINATNHVASIGNHGPYKLERMILETLVNHWRN